MRTNHSFDRSLWIALGVASFTLGMAACGGSGGTGGAGGGAGGGTDTTSSTTSTSSTTTSSTSSTSSSTTTSSTSSSGSMNCTEITAADFAKYQADGSAGIYTGTPSPSLGSATVDDTATLEFYGPDLGSYDGDQAGTFDLTMNGDDNYSTCSRCIRVLEDVDPDNGPAKTYFQQSGTLVVDAASDQLNGKLHATLTDVTLVEVTIDQGTSTPVAGGACLHLASATVTIDPPVVPAGWTCDPTFYGDGDCDCGCGVLDDMDCTDATSASCDYNDCDGGKPNATQNFNCDPVPAGWLCDATTYQDGTCDCGCSIQDPDCATGAASACTNDNCTTSAIDGTNWLCTGVPAGWTCNQSYYGDGDCDCGCGALDMDCTDATVDSCAYCSNPGSCSTDSCPGTIDPANNATCTAP